MIAGPAVNTYGSEHAVHTYGSVCRAPERFSRHYYEDSRHVFAIMNVYMEFAIMSVCSEFAIMSVGTTLSLQIRNNSIIITANKLFCRNFCSRVRQVSNREHGNEFYNKLTGTCKPAAIIH